MRKTVIISSIVVGAFVLIAAGLAAYAYFNLSALVARNQDRILARVSRELGRAVDSRKDPGAGGMGCVGRRERPHDCGRSGVLVETVSCRQRREGRCRVSSVAGGEARVSRLELSKPDIRLVMNANGDLNVASIGANPGEAAEAKEKEQSRRTKKSSLADLSIKALSIEDGEIYFNDLGEKATPIRVHHLDFDVTNFNAASAFDVETKFAFPGDTQNVAASGKLGPLLNQGVLDASGIPVDLTLKLDSIVLDNLRPLADVGPHIPPGLSIPDAASISGTAHGTVATLAIALSTDLTANRVAYTTIFNKPAGTAMTVNVNGTWGDQLQIASVSLKLSDLELTASRISGVTGPQPLSAQLDSNSFNLANLGPMINAVADYDVAGMGEVHGTVTLNPNAPAVDGTVTLKQAALKLGPSVQGGISDLNGSISFANGVGVVAPTSFALGSAHASRRRAG